MIKVRIQNDKEKKDFENGYFRDGVKTIDQLKPVSFMKKDGVIRYDYHQMADIVKYKLGFDYRSAREFMVYYPQDTYRDFWHWAMDATFRGEVRNDQTNSVYIGTDVKKLTKKKGRAPTDWELWIQGVWEETFSHLADKHGMIKVEQWW